jgi:hypothetical protein
LIAVDEMHVTRKEVLNEFVFELQELQADSKVAFCAFNSGKDV